MKAKYRYDKNGQMTRPLVKSGWRRGPNLSPNGRAKSIAYSKSCGLGRHR